MIPYLLFPMTRLISRYSIDRSHPDGVCGKDLAIAPSMPVKTRDHKRGRIGGSTTDDAAMNALDAAWQAVLAVREHARNGSLSLPFELAFAGQRVRIDADQRWCLEPDPGSAVVEFLDLYLPLALVPRGRSFALAHLAQSLDGRIATAGGASQWLTGEADLQHTHRLRALADAVLVGAVTVRQDDPRLTVRRCAGPQPVRVVLDTQLSLDDGRQVFRDGAARTLVLAAADCALGRTRLGGAEIVAVPRDGEKLAPQAIRAALAERGLHWLFIEGGGVTVSRFLAAGLLDRLQIAIAPVLLGSGRPSLALPEIGDLAHALRPEVRQFRLGEDILVECLFHA
jgi:diaminohydroxyphosphoribosylaminopyrimidine deaminase / 5-amino-6-(5-phosphoribosylamino)uracil reductase